MTKAKTKMPQMPAGFIDRAVTTADILDQLDKKYNQDSPRNEWVGFAEFRPGTGFAACSERYIDFWAISCFKSQGYEKISYEIKQSRSDFISEIKNPEKRKMALLVSNQYFFAAPLGLIKPGDLPPEAGLVEYYWASNQHEIDNCLALNEKINENNKKPDSEKTWEEKHFRRSPHYVPEYTEAIKSQITVKAPIREHMVPGWKFIAAVCRRVKRGAS